MNEETNGVIVFLGDLLEQMNLMTMTHGRGALMMTDPQLPVEKVAAFVKTQLTEYVKATKASE